MPVLPNPEEIQRPTYSPVRGVVSYDSSQMGKALEQTGRELQVVSNRAAVFADRTAELHAQDAAVELKRRRNLLTVGPDGYAQLRNGAATEPGVLDNYRERLNAEIEDIKSGMGSMARNKFDQVAKRQDVEFQADVLRHVMQEDLSHRGEVYKAQIGIAAETMALNLGNPDAMARERANIDRSVAEFVDKNGIRDKALIERMLQDARGTAHQQVVQEYVNNDRPREAKSYFEEHRQEMLPEMANSLENFIQPAVENIDGRSIADELFQMHMSGESETAITQAKMRLTDDKSMNTVRVVDKFYGDRLNALTADRQRMSGEVLLSVFNGEQGSGLSDKRLWAIDATDPLYGVQVREKIQAIQQKQAAAAEGEAVPGMGGMAVYAQLAERIRNGESSTEEVIQYADVLPKAEVKSLLTQLGSVEKAAGKYKIAPALVNAGIPKSADDKEEVNAYKGFVEQKLQDWKDRNPGKVPTIQEERQIIKSASEEHVKVNEYWFNSTIEAYATEGVKTYPKRYKQLLPGKTDEELADVYSFVEGIKQDRRKGEKMYTEAELIKLWETRQNRAR